MATRLLRPHSASLPLRRLNPDRRSGQTCFTSFRAVHQTRHLQADYSGVKSLLHVSSEVAEAVAVNRPVVALESTIYTHGALGELHLEDIVRRNGAVPAVCGILAGVPTVGLTVADIERIVNESPRKVSRRDFAYLVGMVR